MTIAPTRVARGVGLPSLLVFLGLGLALVGAGLGVRFDDAGRAQALELTTLVLILAAGALTTHWAYALAAAPAVRVSRARLATVGVAVSGLAVAVTAHWLLALTWRNALLLGAVPTADRRGSGVLGAAQAAAPTPAVRMLEGRSGLNAALPYSVTLLSGPGPPPLVAGIVGYELAAGAAIRLAARPLGALALKVVNPLRPAATRLSAREQYVFSCSLSHPIRPARAAQPFPAVPPCPVSARQPPWNVQEVFSKRSTCSNRLSSVV